MCNSWGGGGGVTECQSSHSVGRFLCFIRVPSDLTPFLTLLGYNVLSTVKESPNKYFPLKTV
jgi:hypothetical protein